MNTQTKTMVRRLTLALGGLAFPLAPLATAQVASAGPSDAALLARYDRNKDGRLDADETAAMDADQKRLAAETVRNAGADEPSLLSPFEVVENTRGYYSANTMSGTRFNTNIGDLGTSIQVITKEQMTDFAMLDINDVFAYSANTEGIHDYTDYEIDANGSISDNVQLNPTGANRVRGMTAANISMGNTEMSGRTPIDPLAVDAIEISRGPNSTVFGLGSPSGTVNMVPSSANLSRNRAQVGVRADSFEGYRTSLDVNRVLWKDKLAVRISSSFQHDGYDLKPSGVDTLRYNGMVKYQPFKGTTVTGSYQYYRMNGNRPNVSPPRDNVSYWLYSGSPGWYPKTRTILLNGVVSGPYPTDVSIPDYFNRTVVSGTNHGWLFIDERGDIQHWSPRQGTGASAPTGTQSVTFLHSSPGGYNAGVAAGGQAALQVITQPLFTTAPSVSDKSLYDWSRINLYAVNRLMDKTETTSFQIDQIFLNSPRHSLAGQVSFLREDSERRERNEFGAANAVGASGQLTIDVNLTYLDGTPNPFFGRPFLNTGAPRFFHKPSRWDSYRAQLAYKLDLSREKGWLKWLGVHQITGYDEYKYRLTRQYTFRDAIVSDHAWIPAGRSRGNQSAIAGGATQSLLVTRVDGRYYVGDNVGGNVDYAPSGYKYGTYPFTWGDAINNVFNREMATLGQVAVTDQTGGNNNTKSILKTLGGVVHSQFWDGRIITTFGLREDRTYSKSGLTPQQLMPDGINFDYESIDHWEVGDWRYRDGRTETRGIVVRPFRGLEMAKRLGSSGGFNEFLGTLFTGLSLHYNRADSFKPQLPAQDLFLRQLPNSTGVGTDYGFGLNLYDGRVVLRVNRYKNSELNSRFGQANTIQNRVLGFDRSRLPNRIEEWLTEIHGTPVVNPTTGAITYVSTWTDEQMDAEVTRVMGFTREQRETLDNPLVAFATTADLVAKGTEVELHVNPTRFWTVSASVTEKESVHSNVAKGTADWIAERMKVWTTIVDPRTNNSWWTDKYGGAQSAYDNYAIFVEAPFNILLQKQGKADPQIRRYNAKVNTNFRLAGVTEHRILKNLNVGGSLRWESKGGIGYYGKQSLPDVVTELDPSRPIYDKAHYYADVFFGYRTRLWSDKVGATFQLNVRNIQEDGSLRPVGAFPDGSPLNYRIIPPRQFILQATFDL